MLIHPRSHSRLAHFLRPSSPSPQTANAMSSAAGLSRRRVPTSTTAGDDDADAAWGFNGGASTPNGSSSRSESLQSPPLHAGSAFEGGSKIAYDPRDLERDDEDARLGGKPPRLTIMEEVLLLGLKDKQVRARALSQSFVAPPPRRIAAPAPMARARRRRTVHSVRARRPQSVEAVYTQPVPLITICSSGHSRARRRGFSLSLGTAHGWWRVHLTPKPPKPKLYDRTRVLVPLAGFSRVLSPRASFDATNEIRSARAHTLGWV